MNYQKALDIIKLNLERKGLKMKKVLANLEIEGVELDIHSNNYSFKIDWTISNVCLKTTNYDTNYKHKRKRVMRFNVVSGNYEKLITKIKGLQLENIKIIKGVKTEEEWKELNYEKVKKIFKNYNLIEKYGSIEIETPYFCICIYPDNNKVVINARFDLSCNYDKIKELLDKLGIKNEKNETTN